MKRLFKGPWVWIVIAVVGVLLALQYLPPSGGYDEIATSKMIEHIDSGRSRRFASLDELTAFVAEAIVQAEDDDPA